MISALTALENSVRTTPTLSSDGVSMMRDQANKIEARLSNNLDPILQELWRIDAVRGQECQKDFNETSDILKRTLWILESS